MRYLCAIYFEPNILQGMSANGRAELDRVSLRYDDELRQSGHYLASSALQPPNTAKTVRSRGGKLLVIDGPFAETKEVLGGFILIEARDIEEALRIAEHIPMVQCGGSVEVRPEMKIG